MTLLNGSKERTDEGSTSHAGVGCSRAAGGRSAVGRGAGAAGGLQTLEVSEATYHPWRAQFGGMKAGDVRRLKELEVENARLKRIVADQTLEVAALKRDEPKGNW